jgi:hypothetical protein
MGIDLYVLKKRAVKVLTHNGIRQSIYFLQLAVENALSNDSQSMVDCSVKYARKEWEENAELPEFAVQVGKDGLLKPGSPIFKWSFFKRQYCFDHELPAPFGYLGEKEAWGYLFRTVNEQARINIAETARRIDEGSTKVFKDFWHGEIYQSGEEYLRFQRQFTRSEDGNGESKEHGCDILPPRVSKILGLIRFIQEKGENASPADLNFLGVLREKAMQLGCSC